MPSLSGFEQMVPAQDSYHHTTMYKIGILFLFLQIKQQSH
jgi:hypothetical protein